MDLSPRALTETPQSPACYILQLHSVSSDSCGRYLPHSEDKKCWNFSVAWLNSRAVFFNASHNSLGFASRRNTGLYHPDVEQELLWTWHWHELCSDEEVALVISWASSIHSFLSCLGLDIYCVITRISKAAAWLTQKMRGCLWSTFCPCWKEIGIVGVLFCP